MTSNKANPSPQASKAALEGQGEKANDKGKVMKPLGKGKKSVTKPTTSLATTAGPSVNL